MSFRPKRRSSAGFSAPQSATERVARGRIGGGRGIRTLDTVPRIHTFQACAFNHSATPPERGKIGGERAIRNRSGRLRDTPLHRPLPVARSRPGN